MNVFNFLALCHVWFALRKRAQTNSRKTREREGKRREEWKITTVTIVTIIQKEKRRMKNEMKSNELKTELYSPYVNIISYIIIYIIYRQNRLPNPTKALLRLLPFCICAITSKLSMTFCVYGKKEQPICEGTTYFYWVRKVCRHKIWCYITMGEKLTTISQTHDYDRR